MIKLKNNEIIEKTDYSVIISCLCFLIGFAGGLFLPIPVGTIFSATLLVMVMIYSCLSNDVKQGEQHDQ